MALSGLSSVVTSKYRNLVGDYEIAYDVKQNTGEKADKVLGSIKKGDLKKGYILCEMDGRKSITIEAGVPDEDAKLLVSSVIDDANNILAERNTL